MEDTNGKDTDLRLARIGLGRGAIGGSMSGGADDDAAAATIHGAPDAGITSIDSAPPFGQRHSAEVVGRFLAGPRFIATTVALESGEHGVRCAHRLEIAGDGGLHPGIRSDGFGDGGEPREQRFRRARVGPHLGESRRAAEQLDAPLARSKLAKIAGGAFDPEFSLANAAKDVRLALQAEAQSDEGVTLPMLERSIAPGGAPWKAATGIVTLASCT